MAPKNSKVAAPQAQMGAARSESTSIEASQDEITPNMQNLVEQRRQLIKERRRERKQAITTAHSTRVEDLRSNIKRALETHEQKVRIVRRPQVERLLELIRKKRELETKIEKSRAYLAQAFFSTAQQLQIALDDRVEELAG